MFIFSSIPGSLIFESFKETRGKKQVIDETKMQMSLIVAYITLGEEDYQMDVGKMIKFLLHFYEKRVRFVDTITDLMLKLNTNDHSSIVTLLLCSISTISCSLEESFSKTQIYDRLSSPIGLSGLPSGPTLTINSN